MRQKLQEGGQGDIDPWSIFSRDTRTPAQEQHDDATRARGPRACSCQAQSKPKLTLYPGPHSRTTWRATCDLGTWAKARINPKNLSGPHFPCFTAFQHPVACSVNAVPNTQVVNGKLEARCGGCFRRGWTAISRVLASLHATPWPYANIPPNLVKLYKKLLD